MTPQDLVKKTILAEASKANTDFVEVTHRGIARLAKIEYGDFREVKKKDKISEIKDSISLLNIELENISRGDTITLDSIDYNIEYFVIVLSSIYNVFAIKKSRTGNSRW